MKKREAPEQPDDGSRQHAPQPEADEHAEPKPDKADPKAGIAREVGDLEDPDAQDDGALPGRAGGGLAGG